MKAVLFFAVVIIFLFLSLFSFVVKGNNNNDTQPEWVPFGNHLYALLKEQHWQPDAEKRCIEWESHLVSIHSKEENEFVNKLRDNNTIWLGRNKINDPGVNGTYSWTDGTPDDFPVPWDQRQPNEPWTDCIFMPNHVVTPLGCDCNGQWSDYFCDQNPPEYYTPNPPFAMCKKLKEKKIEDNNNKKEL